ncbi:4'-phosphopantetheinyl transferase superfamily protein [Defluviimonas sp. WL0002]|uniref:Enterobactin synthase component D n=1 Tax=Albidovulum marisflavi TaxID=2984159 RepID=A0ABT2Z9Q2_9RHOB|nr:4'-phosphopantetheinyl transferase superfamily protein [Defluviimonas sp. WL0002]MCV2867816.1 4'-phosphopantetheinyl transferase superfamily protein [Defluviimonas sp. WL0002]
MPAAQAEMVELTRGLLPGPVAVCASRIGPDDAGLWPVEADAMRRAVPRRRAEFAAGRLAARRAMAELGQTPGAIPMRHDRSPEWPARLTGSITHAGGLALAAVARTDQVAAIGIDAEPDEPLPEGLLGLICRAEERAWCATTPDPGRAARLIFAAKEAAYKCQYPLSGKLFGHEALRITVGGAGRLTACFMQPAGPFAAGETMAGQAGWRHGMIIAAFSVPLGH